jgi:hypothetical protein
VHLSYTLSTLKLGKGEASALGSNLKTVIIVYVSYPPPTVLSGDTRGSKNTGRICLAASQYPKLFIKFL